MSAAENLQREDLSAIEMIEAIVEILDADLIEDAELIENKQNAAMSKKLADRVKALLGKLDSMRRSKERGYDITEDIKHTSNKFIGRVEKIFKNLPKSLEWLSFLNNDLPILMDICEEVREVSNQNHLNREQTRALKKLKDVSPEEFRRVTAKVEESTKTVIGSNSKKLAQIDLKDLSSREIDGIAEKAVKKKSLAELNRPRVSPSFKQEPAIVMMSRMGIPVEVISARLSANRKTAKKYSENPRLIQSIKKSLKKGQSCHKVAEKHCCPEPLVWSIALEGKSDLDRFKALNWGLRTWDLWSWNDCDKRFGDEWPGRIPAQMIAHILYYFSEQGDLVLDPMAGGGVVADTCLALNRRCWSFDMVDRPDTRPEIEPYFWDITNLKWPIKGKTKPDLIIFDPPYYKKQSNNYDPDGISGLSKEKYLEFLETFFALAHLNAKKSTEMAFINADWRDFQNTPAKNETRVNSILFNDYLRILNKSGWEETHIFQAPLSSERFKANVVSAMQKKKIIGVTSRYVIISKKK